MATTTGQIVMNGGSVRFINLPENEIVSAELFVKLTEDKGEWWVVLNNIDYKPTRFNLVTSNDDYGFECFQKASFFRHIYSATQGEFSHYLWDQLTLTSSSNEPTDISLLWKSFSEQHSNQGGETPNNLLQQSIIRTFSLSTFESPDFIWNSVRGYWIAILQKIAIEKKVCSIKGVTSFQVNRGATRGKHFEFRAKFQGKLYYPRFCYTSTRRIKTTNARFIDEVHKSGGHVAENPIDVETAERETLKSFDIGVELENLKKEYKHDSGSSDVRNVLNMLGVESSDKTMFCAFLIGRLLNKECKMGYKKVQNNLNMFDWDNIHILKSKFPLLLTVASTMVYSNKDLEERLCVNSAVEDEQSALSPDFSETELKEQKQNEIHRSTFKQKMKKISALCFSIIGLANPGMKFDPVKKMTTTTMSLGRMKRGSFRILQDMGIAGAPISACRWVKQFSLDFCTLPKYLKADFTNDCYRAFTLCGDNINSRTRDEQYDMIGNMVISLALKHTREQHAAIHNPKNYSTSAWFVTTKNVLVVEERIPKLLHKLLK